MPRARYREFLHRQDGLAMTEYLILLGILTAAVVASILLIGGNLDVVWNSWADWFGETDLEPG